MPKTLVIYKELERLLGDALNEKIGGIVYPPIIERRPGNFESNWSVPPTRNAAALKVVAELQSKYELKD